MTLHEGGVLEAPDFDYFLSTYGLGPQELDTIVTFGEHTGTIATMLEDKRCPVGNFVAHAYKTEGLAGVEARLEGFKRLSSGFEVNISPDTRAHHEGSIDRRTLFERVTPTEQLLSSLGTQVESQPETSPVPVLEELQRITEQPAREVDSPEGPNLREPLVLPPPLEQTHKPRPAKHVIAAPKHASKVSTGPRAVVEKQPAAHKEAPTAAPHETLPGPTIDLWPASHTIEIAKLTKVPVAKVMARKAEKARNAIKPEPPIERQITRVVDTVEVEPVGTEWLAELYKPPTEVFENFTIALQNFIKLSSPEYDEGLIEEPLPSVATVLAERLIKLEPEEKNEVGSMLVSMVGAIHGIQVLEERGASVEEIADAKQQLHEFCIVLLDALRINYTKADVAELMELVLQPDFKPQQGIAKLLDLEREGTHEVKLFKKLATGYNGVEDRLQRILGMFALL